ncbi:hypothetical protein FVE85_8549 [Porphyridium purpureum]|uniref:Uncharacterized protein n=1 Tax=Porphyridium purpureum TaxID=35688 RepID=A0A5J4YQX9_PORPP|nr:hypothetical protein FVE85_8549 [Porphyridium purpureum]|eukprot:POR4114..scf296_7
MPETGSGAGSRGRGGSSSTPVSGRGEALADEALGMVDSGARETAEVVPQSPAQANSAAFEIDTSTMDLSRCTDERLNAIHDIEDFAAMYSSLRGVPLMVRVVRLLPLESIEKAGASVREELARSLCDAGVPHFRESDSRAPTLERFLAMNNAHTAMVVNSSSSGGREHAEQQGPHSPADPRLSLRASGGDQGMRRALAPTSSPTAPAIPGDPEFVLQLQSRLSKFVTSDRTFAMDEVQDKSLHQD